MTADQLNSHLDRGLMGSYEIKQLKASPSWATLEAPSDNTYAAGVNDSVTQQAHRIDAGWDATHKVLTLSLNTAGNGYWIPYQGNGASKPAGVAITQNHGLGTYTPPVDGVTITWVATGPFSGCYAVSFTPAAGGKVFAHVITAADSNHPADSVDSQVANVATQAGAPVPADITNLKVTSKKGFGYVFWILLSNIWYRRIVYMYAGDVKAVDAKTKI